MIVDATSQKVLIIYYIVLRYLKTTKLNSNAYVKNHVMY